MSRAVGPFWGLPTFCLMPRCLKPFGHLGAHDVEPPTTLASAKDGWARTWADVGLAYERGAKR